MNILAVDVAAGAVKAAVLDTEAAQPVGPIARATYAIDSPVPAAAEVAAERLWQAVAAAGRSAILQSGVAGKPGSDVQGVGLSCMAPGLVLLGKNDLPVRPILIPLDRRARPAARQVWATVGEEFLASAGSRPVPGGMSAVMLRQLLAVDPYLLHEIQTYLHVGGWLGFHLTGEKAFDPMNASCTGLFGTITDRQWSRRWGDYFEIDPHWLPPVRPANATLGSLRADVAAELSVPAGVPCKVGTTDVGSAILAAGMKRGDLLHEAGATQILAALTGNPVAAPDRLIRLMGVGNDHVQITQNPVGTAALEWLRALCFRDQNREQFFATSIPAALARKTRVMLEPPYLAANLLEIDANRAAFRDLELTTDRLDLLGALLEAMARRHRDALATLGLADSLQKVFVTGAPDLLRSLLPGYQAANIVEIQDASLRGVAKLFGGDDAHL